MGGMNPGQSAPPQAKPSKIRAWLLGVAQALGMAFLARACALASAALFVGVPAAQAGPWWAQAPGWIALVWLSKRAARSGWWTIRGAWIFAALAASATAGMVAFGGEGMGAGWLAACLWACLWPKARARAREMAEIDAAKAESKRAREARATERSGGGAP